MTDVFISYSRQDRDVARRYDSHPVGGDGKEISGPRLWWTIGSP